MPSFVLIWVIKEVTGETGEITQTTEEVKKEVNSFRVISRDGFRNNRGYQNSTTCNRGCQEGNGQQSIDSNSTNDNN